MIVTVLPFRFVRWYRYLYRPGDQFTVPVSMAKNLQNKGFVTINGQV
jgi:hypothetical protein